MKTNTHQTCPCCGAALRRGLCDWHWACPACAYESVTLEAGINQADRHERIDESARSGALRELRQANFARLLALIESHLPALPPGQARARLLDVGAGHGWFVQAALARHEVTGIEPDDGIRASAAAGGVTLMPGYFPDCLRDGQWC